MSRIPDILDKAQRDGAVRRLRVAGDAGAFGDYLMPVAPAEQPVEPPAPSGAPARIVTGVRLDPRLVAESGDAVAAEQYRSAIIVLAGYRIDVVRCVCGPDVEFVHNDHFASTNSVYSLWLARHALTGGFIVLNCDVLFHTRLFDDLVSARYEDAALVCVCARGDSRYPNEEMKVRIRAGRIVEFSKAMASDDADAENVGIVKFGAAGAAVLVEELDRLVAAGAVREWVTAAFGAFCGRRLLYAVETRGLPWIEIDVPEDYERACAQVLPALLSGDAQGWQPAAAAAARRVLHHV